MSAKYDQDPDVAVEILYYLHSVNVESDDLEVIQFDTQLYVF